MSMQRISVKFGLPFLKENENYYLLNHILKEIEGFEKVRSEINRNIEGKVKECNIFYIKRIMNAIKMKCNVTQPLNANDIEK